MKLESGCGYWSFPQKTAENNVSIIFFSVTFRSGTVKCNVQPVLDVVAEVLEPGEGGLFELIFGYICHGSSCWDRAGLISPSAICPNKHSLFCVQAVTKGECSYSNVIRLRLAVISLQARS